MFNDEISCYERATYAEKCINRIETVAMSTYASCWSGIRYKY